MARRSSEPIYPSHRSSQPKEHDMTAELAAASRERRARLHADRAPRRDHHPRDPACDRDPLVPQLPHPGEQVRGAGQRPRRSAGHGGVQRRPRHRLHRRDADKLQGSYDAGIKNIKISVANSTTYCIVNTSRARSSTTSPARRATSSRAAARPDFTARREGRGRPRPSYFTVKRAARNADRNTVSLSPRVRILAAAGFAALLALLGGYLLLGGGAGSSSSAAVPVIKPLHPVKKHVATTAAPKSARRRRRSRPSRPRRSRRRMRRR